jgi:hypothetical protein
VHPEVLIKPLLREDIKRTVAESGRKQYLSKLKNRELFCFYDQLYNPKMETLTIKIKNALALKLLETGSNECY